MTTHFKNMTFYWNRSVGKLTVALGLLLSLTSVPTMMAQKTTAKKRSASTTTAQTQSAEQLMQSYKFTEAARLLQREIDAARSSGRSTMRLEADLQRANLGIDMLRGTERVTFIDSIVVSRKDMLQRLQLSANAGKVVCLKDVLSEEQLRSGQYGQAGYINELNDRVIFSKSDSTGCANNLHIAYRVGNGWSAPTPLEGMHDVSCEQDFPFMMPDGVTLYYGAQGEESLGGYDIFVTRYNPDTKQYLKAENIGMPFNSPANDYLLAIDESTQIGFLLTDRNQKPDSVCIYAFIPNTTRDIYEMSDANKKRVIHAAMLHSISETQTDQETTKAALQRLNQLRAQAQSASTSQGKHLYVINDHTIYTSLNEFRSETARRIAQQADEIRQKLQQLLVRQDELQKKAFSTKLTQSDKDELREANVQIPTLQKQYDDLCKNMRVTEIK